jgi:hypothetical protein
MVVDFYSLSFSLRAMVFGYQIWIPLLLWGMHPSISFAQAVDMFLSWFEKTLFSVSAVPSI